MTKTQKLSFYSGGPSPHKVPRSYWEWLSVEALQNKDATAIISVHQGPEHLSNLLKETRRTTPSECFTWTFGQLLESTERLAASWTASGVRSGSTVCTMTWNAVECIILHWAAARLGAVFAALEPSALQRDAEMKFMAEAIDAAVIYVEDPSNMELADKYFGTAKVKLMGSSGGDARPGWTQLVGLDLHGLETAPQPPLAGKDDTILILSTSGSTGLPKLVPKSLQNWTTEVDDYRSFAGANWSSHSRLVTTTSNFRTIYCIVTTVSLRGAGSVVIAGPRFEAHAVLDVIVEFRCTHAITVPYALRSLIQTSEAENIRVSSLQFVSCSGDMVDTRLLDRGKTQLRIERLVGAWGMTETHPVFGWREIEEVPVSEHNIVGVGRPLPGSTAKVCKPGIAKEVLPRNTIGELLIQSTTTITAYGGKNPPTDVFLRDEGGGQWFHTGDLAIMDGTGVVFIVGRTKDVIECKAYNVIPSLLEDFLKDKFHYESKVIGIPDELSGAVPIGIVQGTCDSGTKQTILKSCPKYLGAEYDFGAIYELGELGLDGWPRNSSDKIDKTALKEAVVRTHAKASIRR